MASDFDEVEFGVKRAARPVPPRAPVARAEPKAAAAPSWSGRQESSGADSPGTDGVLVPIDQWNRVLAQLGNLHEAGKDLAAARERAAKAETTAEFLRERLAELRVELSEAKEAVPVTAREQVGPMTGDRQESEKDRPANSIVRTRMREVPVKVTRWWIERRGRQGRSQ